MIHIVTEISKYVIAIIMALYTIRCFSYFTYSSEYKKNSIIVMQKILIYIFQAISMIILYLNTSDITVGIVYIALAIFSALMMSLFSKIYPKISLLVLNNMCILINIGIIIQLRLDEGKALKQFVILSFSLVISLIVPIIIRKISSLYKLKYLYAFLGIIMLLGVFILGRVEGGAKLNIGIMGISFQLSEIVKILFIFYIASSLYNDISFNNIIKTSILAGAQVIILVVSKDLGAAVILFVSYIIVLFVASRRASYIVLGTIFGSVSSLAAYKLFNHVRIRVLVWLDPFKYYDRGGYQIAQSLFAIGTGGLFGMGLTKGMPENIPVADEDFVFSAIAEEFGVIFAVCLILVCVSSYIMFLNIAMQLQNRFYKLVALGLGSLYIFQVFLNIGGVINFIPSTGVTLPFVSYGGSSLVSTMLMFAIIQGLYILRNDEERIIMHKKIEENNE